MLLHIDGSRHRWFHDERWYDLLVILDDATSEIYYAQLVEEESTRTVMAAWREVIQKQGLFCSLYSDRGSHFFLTPKAGEKVDPHRLTQVGRAMKQLGIKMIPAYSPQARGRSERNFGTWQGRLPQELRLAGIRTLEAANEFLRRYREEFNGQFSVPAAQRGTAFRRCGRRDLDWVFTIQTERVVANDNTITIRDQVWQLEQSRWRHTLAGCTVTSMSTWTGWFRCATDRTWWGVWRPAPPRKNPSAVEKTGPWKGGKTNPRFPLLSTAPWKSRPPRSTFSCCSWRTRPRSLSSWLSRLACRLAPSTETNWVAQRSTARVSWELSA